MKKKDKNIDKNSTENLLRKLSRVELLELLLEQTKRVELLEIQLQTAQQQLEEQEAKLQKTLSLAKTTMELVEQEAVRIANELIEKAVAEGKLLRPAEPEDKPEDQKAHPVQQSQPAPEAMSAPQPEIQPQMQSSQAMQPVPQIQQAPAQKLQQKRRTVPVTYYDSNGQVDVARILGGK